MPVNRVIDQRNPSISMQTDLELLLDCVNGIRNAYAATDDRQPSSDESSERRASARVPLQVPIRVTPVLLENGEVRAIEGPEASFSAITANLSLRGLAFTHAEPLKERYAVVTFDLPRPAMLSLLIEIRWTAPSGDRLATGARFLALTEFPAPKSKVCP